jgi:uncharacterized protein YjbJ (UPF0337 family)
VAATATPISSAAEQQEDNDDDQDHFHGKPRSGDARHTCSGRCMAEKLYRTGNVHALHAIADIVVLLVTKATRAGPRSSENARDQGCAIMITNFRRAAVVSAYDPIALEILEATTMDKDRIKGSAEQAKGKVEEVVGKATGDSKFEGEGKADQFKGKVQNAVGGLKDTLRGK